MMTLNWNVYRKYWTGYKIVIELSTGDCRYYHVKGIWFHWKKDGYMTKVKE